MAWVPVPAARRVRADLGRPDIKLEAQHLADGLLPGFLPTVPDGLLNGLTVPGLHNLITRIPPVTNAPAPYAALFELNWLSASGTACFLAAIAAAICCACTPRVRQHVRRDVQAAASAMLTIASMLGLAYLMNYSGMTSTLGLALAATGLAFPFFSAVWDGWACSSPAATRRRTRCSATCRSSRPTRSA